MDMSRVSQHVEDELQTFLELLFPSAIMFRSSILIKKEKIELFSKVKEEIIELPNNWKEKAKELQSKVEENIMLQIVKKETLKLHKINNHQNEKTIAHFLFSWSKHRKIREYH
jgi:ABC-type sugar transport system ATPase subunit